MKHFILALLFILSCFIPLSVQAVAHIPDDKKQIFVMSDAKAKYFVMVNSVECFENNSDIYMSFVMTQYFDEENLTLMFVTVKMPEDMNKPVLYRYDNKVFFSSNMPPLETGPIGTWEDLATSQIVFEAFVALMEYDDSIKTK